MKYFLLGALSVIILGLSSGGAYYVGYQKGLEKNKPTPTPTAAVEKEPLLEPTESPTPTQPFLTKATVKAKIVAAVTNRTYADLKPLMVTSPEVIIESSGCCGPLTQDEAVVQLSYLNNAALPWNFNDSNPQITALHTKNPQGRYKDAIIGIAANEYTVAFQLDAQNKISRITMSVTYKLVLP